VASKRSDALLYGFGRGIMTLLYVLPLGAAIGFTRWVAGLYFRLDRRHQRIADVNLSIAFPDMTPARRQQVARDSYRNLGEMLAGSVRLHGRIR
jgi:lauroyl/myristoyl acyltransferase